MPEEAEIQNKERSQMCSEELSGDEARSRVLRSKRQWLQISTHKTKAKIKDWSNSPSQ